MCPVLVERFTVIKSKNIQNMTINFISSFLQNEFCIKQEIIIFFFIGKKT